MSTVSGFVLGLVTAAGLAVLYADRISGSLEPVVEQYLPESVRQISTVGEAPIREPGRQDEPLPEPPVAETASAAGEPAAPTLEQRWAEFAAAAETAAATGEFPWRACFRRAAASHDVPETLLLALASGESNFDPAARSDKDAIGLMQIRWPGTGRHLGILREADLYDPCTNVDAGARYMAELAAHFDDNLHLAVAAYNYGPGRIRAGEVPDGARWYSQYIYQHLQQVLGADHVPSSELVHPGGKASSNYLTLMRFNRSQRARDYIVYLRGELPELELRQRSERLGQHEVIMLYASDAERERALEAIYASGVATLELGRKNKLSL